VNNPLRILQCLDRNLNHPAELTIFGRAALALGFPAAPAAFGATQDLDAILPLGWLEAEEQNLDFWEAQQKTNAELEGTGLYITHLFRELEIILTPDWIMRRILLQLPLLLDDRYVGCRVAGSVHRQARSVWQHRQRGCNLGFVPPAVPTRNEEPA
jgi:hypothetical protein